MRIIKPMVVVAALMSGAAGYARQGMTQQEVRAELARAQAAGELGVAGEAWDGSAAVQAKEVGMYGRTFAETIPGPEIGAALPDDVKQQMLIDYVGGA